MRPSFSYLLLLLALILLGVPLLVAPQGSLAQDLTPKDKVFLVFPGNRVSTVRAVNIRNGATSAQFTIPNSSGTTFLLGNWDGSGQGVGALKLSKSKVTVALFTQAGTPLRTAVFPATTSNLHSIVVGDFNNDGFDDIALITKKFQVSVFNDPGTGTAAPVTFKIPRASSFAAALTRKTTLGIAGYDQNTGVVTVTDFSGRMVKQVTLTRIRKGVILPIGLYTDVFSFLIQGSDRVGYYDEIGVELYASSLPDNGSATTGDYFATGVRQSAVAIINPIGAIDTTIPGQEYNSSIQFDVSLPDQGKVTCDQNTLAQLTSELLVAVLNNDKVGAKRIQKQLNDITAACASGGSSVGGSASIGNKGNNLGAPSSQEVLNGGIGLLCSRQENPKDGAGKGFVAKPSDKDGKLVIVIPGSFAVGTGTLYNAKSLSKLETAQFGGYGNPAPDKYSKGSSVLRGHYRFNKLQYGSVIFQLQTADGTKACWSFSANGGRVD